MKRQGQSVARPPEAVRRRGSVGGDLAEEVRTGIGRVRRRLLELQRPDGHWCAELEGDTILESEYVLTLHYLGRSGEERAAKAGAYLRSRQLPEGGWPLYPEGPPDVSASVKAYFVLKLLGDEPEAPHMRRAREEILRLGGLEASNSFTKLYLAIFGQLDWDEAPAVPPELILFPRWFPFNIYEMSSWSRAIVVPLSVFWAAKPRRPVPERARIDELRSGARGAAGHPAIGDGRGRLWGRFFVGVDRFFKLLERLRLRPLRRTALRRAERWILERLEGSDGLAAIFPPIINSIIALDCLGYRRDDPLLAAQIRELEKLEVEDETTLRVQPCKSPVWDTCLALDALAEAGLPPGDPALAAAARWIAEREVRRPGDWRIKNPRAPVGGWYFEYANELYPDCDDTAQILTGLAKLRLAEDGPERAAAERAWAWLLAMQNDDGGWASFDRGCDKEWLTYVPFADHNAMIDPSTTDITGRVLEAMGARGWDRGAPELRRAVDFVRRQQEPDGSWYGRWGCNYLYGTFLALGGLVAVGEDPGEEWGRRAAAWLRDHQNLDGGWGELPASYDDPALKGRGPSTAAQTAWALLGLLAAGEGDSECVRRGVRYLLDRQLDDGGWEDAAWTGTGFPRVFYLKYHYYAIYFPLLALARYAAKDAAIPEPR